MATELAMEGHDSKMHPSNNVTSAMETSTGQHHQDHMVNNNDAKSMGGDDTVANSSLDHFENFSIREYVFSVRARDIKRNWPFSHKYMQISLENGRQPLLPPFESHKDILQGKFSKREIVVIENERLETTTVSDCMKKEKSKDPKNSENSIHREGCIRKQKICRRKKKSAPGKARPSQTSTGNGKECILAEDITDVEELNGPKGDRMDEKENSRDLRQNGNKCQEIGRDSMIPCESKGMDYVAYTNIARPSNSAIGEHEDRQVRCEPLDKQQKNDFEKADIHINDKSGKTVRKKKGKKIVTCELKSLEDTNKEQDAEKSKEEGEKNDDLGNSTSLPDALIPKVCPVCRTFSSTSNTALNAHIDHCLSIESNAKKGGTKFGKPRVKTIKKRSLAEICAVALPCTLEELEHNIDEDQSIPDANQIPLDGQNCTENTKRRPCRPKPQSVHADTKGKKLRNLSNLKEHCQPEEFQQKKFSKKRKRAASNTSVQCTHEAGTVPNSISSKKLKKKVHATSPAKCAYSEDTVKDKSPTTTVVTPLVERSSISGNTRVEIKEKLTGSKQVCQDHEPCDKNNGGSTDVLETTKEERLEEEIQKSPSKSASPLSCEVDMTMTAQPNNVTQAAEISESDCSLSVEVSGISSCQRKRHTSRPESQNEMKQSVSRNESTSGSPTLEEESRSNTKSASEVPTKFLKFSEVVNMQTLGSVIESKAQPNSVVMDSFHDSQMSFASEGASIIGHPENRTFIGGCGPLEVSTEEQAHAVGASTQDLTNEVQQIPVLCEGNERNSFPLSSYENLNQSKTPQKEVSPQKNSGTQCFSLNDVAKERVKSVSVQKQAMRQSPTTQNNISYLDSVPDASAILSPSNRQFSRDPVLSNILHATTNISESSSNKYLYNGLVIQQPSLHSTQVTSLSNNINSNNIWMTETEHSNSRNMKERPQEPVQKLPNISGYVFGNSVWSSSSISFKGPAVTSQGNFQLTETEHSNSRGMKERPQAPVQRLPNISGYPFGNSVCSSSTSSKGPSLATQGNFLQKQSLQAKDCQYLNHQPSFGSMKLTSVTVPQVVSASTLAKQLGEGKTAEEILHGCVMIEQNSNSSSFQSTTVHSSSHNSSTSPLEKQIASKQNLINPLFGITNGSYGANQVIGVAPYAYNVQKSCSSNSRSFTSGPLSTTGAAYSSGLATNQGQSDPICIGNIDCSGEAGMLGNPILRLMGKNLMVTNKDGGQSKQLDTNPTGMEEYPNASYLRLLGFASEEKLWQDGNNPLGQSIESSISFNRNILHTLEDVKSQESRFLWNENGASQQPTSVVGNLSEWLTNLAGSTTQMSVDTTLPSAGSGWSHSGLPSSSIKFPSSHVSLTAVENRTSSSPVGTNYQAKKQLSSIHPQSGHTVIVISDSPDVETVSNLPGLESASFSAWPSKFQEDNSTCRIPNSDYMFGSGMTWPQISNVPSHLSACKESTITCTPNLQRAREVRAELRRLGITNTGNSIQDSSVIHSQSDHEVIIIDDTPDAEPVSILQQTRQSQEGHPDSMFRSGNTWPQISSIPCHFPACKESTLACGLNHQRAKEVQAELRRLGITNPGIVQSPSTYLKPMRGG